MGKERAMRQQRLRRYLARLHSLKRQRPRYDTLLPKLGAAQAAPAEPPRW